MRNIPVFILLILCSSVMMAQEVKHEAILAPPAQNHALEPDVYPSQRAAAAALAVQVVRGLDQFAWNGRTLQITGQGGSENEPWMDQFIGSLQSQLPNVKVSRTVLDADIVLSVSRKTRQGVPPDTGRTDPRNGGVRRRDSGELTAQLSGAVSGTLSSRYMDVPWADDFAEFINTAPNKALIVGQSDRLCASETEAEQGAIRDAARQLLPHVQNRIGVILADTDRTASEQLIGLIAQQLSDSGMDRFVQRFDRPYGSLWQESVLVSWADWNLVPISARVASAMNSQRATWKMTWLSTVAFFGVIVLLYWFLNAVTKGYFTGRLRFGAVLMLVLWMGLLTLFYLKFLRSRPMTQIAPRVLLDRSR